MKRFISSLAALSFLAATMVVGPVEAAALTAISVDGGSTGTNITAGGANRVRVLFTNTTNLPSGGTIALTFANGFVGTSVLAGDITLTAGGATVASIAKASVGGGTDNRITITTATAAIGASQAVVIDFNGVNKITVPASGIYQTTVTTSVSDFGAAFAYVGTANQVSVSATVDPILSFALDTNTLALGSLPTAVDTFANDGGATKINPTVSSNAGGGINVVMTSTGLKSATAEIGVTDIAGGVAQTAAVDYYKVSTNATPNITDANGANMTTAPGTDMLASQTVYSIATPVAGGTVGVTVAARAATTTEAGNYTDTLTFTATPTF